MAEFTGNAPRPGSESPTACWHSRTPSDSANASLRGSARFKDFACNQICAIWAPFAQRGNQIESHLGSRHHRGARSRQIIKTFINMYLFLVFVHIL